MRLTQSYYDMKKINEFEAALKEFCHMENEGKKIYYKDYHDSYGFPQPRDIQSAVQKYVCKNIILPIKHAAMN